MPRIIITSGAGVGSDGFGRPCMLDELVSTGYLNDNYASLRLLERICWAVEDAEQQERDDAVPTEDDAHHLADEMQAPRSHQRWPARAQGARASGAESEAPGIDNNR